MHIFIFLISTIFILLTLAFFYVSLIWWTAASTALLLYFSIFFDVNVWALLTLWILFAAAALILNIKSIRQKLLSRYALALFQKVAPKMSRTEQEALNAGNVSFEGELFSGRPDFEKMLSLPRVTLSKEEQAFLDGPVEKLCSQIDDWDILTRADLPQAAWKFLRENGFFGMIIPKKYGGLEFSAWAHASVVMKTASKSGPLAISIAVPNSLGPAELLIRYGTKEQKNHYLPRLAMGIEIPCFALTSLHAGSDAASIQDNGVICYDEYGGKKVLGIRLNWEKRYITLAPIATVIGLAFKLYDPQQLLGNEVYLGITCALIPAHLKGVTTGRRHNPLNVHFQNGPTEGKDVFVPLDYIIGGEAMIGQGWRMLMECLGVGRSITLPSAGTAGSLTLAATTGAYAKIRKQFGVSIGEFEGIQEPLAQIGTLAYTNIAGLRFVISALDSGKQPAVAAAIMKYHVTEQFRKVINDAMDIHGGKGICLGPKNYLAQMYNSAPINITVEGANILTRNMIIFGQGAIRCHPFVMDEMNAAKNENLEKFDNIFFKHMGFIVSNLGRSLLLGITSSLIAKSPRSKLKRYYQHLSRFAAAYAFATDLAMITFGGKLKRAERVSARLGDILSDMYFACAILKNFHEQNEDDEYIDFARFALDEKFFRIQNTFITLSENFHSPVMGFILHFVTFPLGTHFKAPKDKLGQRIASSLMKPSIVREWMKSYIFKGDGSSIDHLEKAFQKVTKASNAEKKLHDFKKTLEFNVMNDSELAQKALEKGIVLKEELELLIKSVEARNNIIAVDDFAKEQLGKNC